MVKKVEVLESKKRSRFTVDLPDSLASALSEFVNEHDITQSHAVRRAIKLLIELNALEKEGFKLTGSKETDRDRETVRILIGL